MNEMTTAVFLTLDQLETLEFLLEENVYHPCCEGHQESAASLYEPIQLAAARLQNAIDDHLRKHGED